MLEADTQTLIALIVLLLLLSAVFSSSETAIFCLDRLRLDARKEGGSRTAARLAKLIDNPEKTLTLILVCNNVCNFSCSALVTLLTTRLYGEAAVAVAVGLLTFVVLVFAEITPKTLAARHPELIAFPAAWVFPALMVLLWPVLIGLKLITGLILYPFRSRAGSSEDGIGDGELRTLLRSSRIRLPRRRTRMLLNILDFENLCVEDVMIPRNEIQGVDLTKGWNEILEQIKMNTYADILFYEDSLDNIKGSCPTRNLLDLLIEDRLNIETLTARIEEPMYIVEGTLLTRLMVNIRNQPAAHLILVLNEYDSLQGLLTRNDILKRINPDRAQDDPTLLKRSGDGIYLADASMRVDAVNVALSIDLPTAENLTLNGLITNHLESIPQKDVSVQIAGVTFEVVKSMRNQILLLRIILPPGQEHADTASPSDD
ncbi:MAG: CNNM domain-containing protein [Gammaproteobacteria bacterium]|nr:CNNM domain-containing protein [Pseudomonadota bacterium]MCH9663197.1 CNNM domain-containing protein [Gammaproteobacteria bacterium]